MSKVLVGLVLATLLVGMFAFGVHAVNAVYIGTIYARYGESFEIAIDNPLPLKTAYTKLAEWAEKNDYLQAETMCPVALSVVDENGHRVGAYQGKNYTDINNARATLFRLK